MKIISSGYGAPYTTELRVFLTDPRDVLALWVTDTGDQMVTDTGDRLIFKEE